MYAFLDRLDDYILFGIYLVAIPVGVYAFIHALMQRSDAFTAADKLTKPAWLGITGASALVLVVFQGPRGSGALFWLAALVAALVYIVDVKPAVIGVQGGGHRW